MYTTTESSFSVASFWFFNEFVPKHQGRCEAASDVTKKRRSQLLFTQVTSGHRQPLRHCYFNICQVPNIVA